MLMRYILCLIFFLEEIVFYLAKNLSFENHSIVRHGTLEKIP